MVGSIPQYLDLNPESPLESFRIHFRIDEEVEHQDPSLIFVQQSISRLMMILEFEWIDNPRLLR